MKDILATGKRIESIDLLRGLVMVIMALDHVRDFFHAGSIAGQDPLDCATTTIPFFLTRWITHYCAPIFVFLSGTSIFLQHQRKSTKDLARFLWTRGLFLLFIEFSLITYGWTGNIHFEFFVFQVIGAIGVSMAFMAFLIFLPFRVLLTLGLTIFFGHNLLDPFDYLAEPDQWGIGYAMMHTFHMYDLPGGKGLGIIYPVLPWLGIMLCGYALGHFFTRNYPKEKRFQQLLGLGLVAILAFILIRWSNGYGDSKHWSVQHSGIMTALSFVNTAKYPPSLLYGLMTLGPALIFLAFAEGFSASWTRIFIIFGRVPMFYYILHIYLIRILSQSWVSISGLEKGPNADSPFGLPEGFGANLPGTYLIWFLVVFILYFPCRWYQKKKAASTSIWYSYL